MPFDKARLCCRVSGAGGGMRLASGGTDNDIRRRSGGSCIYSALRGPPADATKPLHWQLEDWNICLKEASRFKEDTKQSVARPT